MEITIPFNRSDLQGREIELVQTAISSGQIAGDQAFTRKCESLLQEELNLERCLPTTSCTHALEMSAILLEIGPDDEVILPSFAFVSTANAFVLRGAKPVFADIRPDTLNLDERQLESLITPQLKSSCRCTTLVSLALWNSRGGRQRSRPVGEISGSVVGLPRCAKHAKFSRDQKLLLW